MQIHHRLRVTLAASASWRAAIELSLAAALLVPAQALANPVGGTVTTGSATIASPSSHQTTIDQASEGVVIDWSSFNIGNGQTTNFVQPNSSAIAINRIGGSAPTKILGTLDANGRIVLIDGNGIAFGHDASVNVGSLIATTTDGSDSDLLAGKFTTAGSQNAAIVNKGTIDTAGGGTVALVAPNVTNKGTVQARLGTVALGAANAFTVDFAGDGLVSFAAQGDVDGKARVTNIGSLSGANVSMTARAAEGLATGVVNVRGTIAAQGAHQVGGAIVLDAGDGGDVAVSNANLDASGTKGGGSVAIGGWNQASVTVDKASVINASATRSGNGGNISVIGAAVNFEGEALAQGGQRSGDGGSVETSGHVVDTLGARIDALAPHGATGTWTLDPENVTISTGATSTDTCSAGVCAPTGKNSVLNVTTLENALSTANVEVTTGGTGSIGSQAGTITVSAPVAWSASMLTLDAFGAIKIDAALTGSDATLNLIAGGTIASNSAGVITAETLTGSSVGATTLSEANSIGDLGAFSTGNGAFSLTDAQALTVTGAVDAGAGNLTLKTTGAGNGIIIENELTAGKQATLISAGTMAESGAGVITVATLTGSSVGGAMLDSTNKVVTLGTFTNSGAGGFALTDGGTLAIGGAVSAGTGNLTLTTTGTGSNIVIDKAITAGETVDLTSTGAISQTSAGIVTAAVLMGSAGAATTLSKANEIANLGAFSNTGGAFSLTDDQSLAISGTINSGTHEFVLVDSATIDETTGIIDAATLTGKSAGSATINGANQIATLDAFTNAGTGGFSLTDDGALVINGAVNAGTGTLMLTTTGSGDGITIKEQLTANNQLTLTSAGRINESGSGAIVAASLTGSSMDGVTLNGANRIATLDAFTNTGPGGLALNDDEALTVSGPLNAGTGNLSLTGDGFAIDTALNAPTLVLSSTGSVTQTQAITASSLDLLGAGGTYALTNASNSIGTLAASTGAINLADDTGLTIGAVGTTNGATTSGALTLNSTGTISQTSAGIVTAGTLSGISVGTTALTAANKIANLGAFTNTAGTLTLTDDQSLSITGAVNTGTYGITLVSTGAITESGAGAIAAASLTGSAVGGETLNGANQVATLDAFTNTGSGGFSFNNSEALTVAGLLNAGAGTLTLTTTAGAIAIDTALSAPTVVLSSPNSVTQSQPITASGLDLLGVGGSYTLTNASNSVGTLAGNTGAINLTDNGALAIGSVGTTAGVTTSGALTLTLAGTISESGTGAIAAASLTGSSVGGATLSGANQIATLDAFTNTGAGGFSLGDGEALTVAGPLNAGTGNIALETTGGGIAIDTALSAPTLVLSSTGSVTQSQPITAGSLDLLGAGGNYTLTNTSNSIGTLAGNTGAINLTDNTALAVDIVGSTNGVTTSGALTLTTSGLTTALQGYNLTVDAALTGASINLVSSGAITVDSPMATAGNLTLDASNNTGGGSAPLTINAPITVSGASSVVLDMPYTTIDLSVTPTHLPLLSFGPAGTLSYSAVNDGASLTINGANYTLAGNIATLASDIASDPYGNFALANSYNAAADGTYTAAPIPTVFSGTLEGLGNVISNLDINDSSSTDNVGLFAEIGASGFVRDINLVNSETTSGAMSAGANVGTLVGLNQGLITNVSAAVTVMGGEFGNVGGLIGENNGGTIIESYVTGTVGMQFSNNLEGGAYVGGLIGSSYGGTVFDTFAAVNVSAGEFGVVGGLIGWNETGANESGGAVDGGGATGTVTVGGNGTGGGLVGANAGGTISAYATGNVNGGAGAVVGGLVGSNFDSSPTGSYATGTLDGCYATGVVTSGGIAGGLVGTSSGIIEGTYATGAVTGVGDVGGLAGGAATILQSWSSGNVSGTGNVGGLAGSQGDDGEIEQSYATGTVTGTASGSSVGGLVGFAEYDTIKETYATGAVAAPADSSVGGLSGTLEDGLITESYSTGAVTGGINSNIGGLIGLAYFAESPYSYVSETYASGNITAGQGSAVGGLVGYIDEEASYIYASYWDTTTTGVTNLSQGAGNISNDSGITGLTTSQLQSELPASYPSVWGYDAAYNDGLPYLLALAPTYCAPSGCDVRYPEQMTKPVDVLASIAARSLYRISPDDSQQQPKSIR